MTRRTTTRAGVALLAAFCVATMFVAPAAAQLGGIGDQVPEGPSGGDITGDLILDAGSSGGEGGGEVGVESGQGNASGSGSAAVDAEEPSVEVSASGGGDVAGQGAEAGIDCELSQQSAQNPQETCEIESPGGGDTPAPEPPELPEFPGGGELPADLL